MKRKCLLTILCCLISYISFSQILSDEENKLYTLLMAYRKEMGLPSIPLSKSLTKVAQTHVKDLQQNYIFQDKCNMHSWSAKGKWTACCYTPNHAKATCMWNKPRELTTYKGNGYEIAFGIEGAEANAEEALEGWKQSAPHNALIANTGLWNETWNAIGVGIFGGFAVVWFGNEVDK